MNTGSVSLALSAVALGTAVFTLTRERPAAPRAPVRTERVSDLEAQVAALTRALEAMNGGRPVASDSPATPWTGRSEETVAAPPADEGENVDALARIVDSAVDKKTKRVLDEMRIKANKKPAIDVFASMLELTPEQRALTERVIVEGQRQLHGILATPTADGHNFMDELVEIVAKGFAEPGKDHGFGRWFARIVSEKIPGTDETYGARIETIKASMHESFQREWTKEQYREFQEWGVDPTEIDKVPGSPNEILWKRIIERATELGAEIPSSD